MSQMTIYLDEPAMRAVKKAARQEHMSVSRWARRLLCEAIQDAWPADYFKLFGALGDNDIARPSESALGEDAPRKAM